MDRILINSFEAKNVLIRETRRDSVEVYGQALAVHHKIPEKNDL
jgi:hypothetical protein